MKLKALPVSATVAVLVGLAQTYFLLFCWAYIAAYSPHTRWLLDLGLQGNAFYIAMFFFSFLISIVLSLPAALALLRLRPSRLWLYLLLAIGPGFVWLNWGLIENPMSFAQYAGAVALGWLPELFALPIAAWLLRLVLKRPGAPNNSFKPKPLRGSA
ncbi:hypothetical protein [Lysobacter sp. P5_B9]